MLTGMGGFSYHGMGAFTPSISLFNVTQGKDVTGGGSFNVGDKFRLSISNVGSNLNISATASQNGASLGTTIMGNSGSNGGLQIDGVMTNNELGSWIENWIVPSGGGEYPALNRTISFTVVTPGSGGNSGGGSGGGGGNNSNSTNTTNTTNTGNSGNTNNTGNAGNGNGNNVNNGNQQFQLPFNLPEISPTMLIVGIGIVGLLVLRK